jgi:integrase
LCGLRWMDVDLGEGELTVAQQLEKVAGPPKTTRSRRTLPLDPDTVDALRWQHRRQAEERMRVGLGRAGDDGLVFTRSGGEPTPRHEPYFRLQQVAKELGLPKLTLHGGRHTALTIMAASENPKVVSETAGHASVRFTLDHYVHPDRDAARAAAERQSAAIPRRNRRTS